MKLNQKSDEEKFAKFKEEYKNYMQGIIDELNKSSEVNVNKKANKGEYETRGISSENIKEHFNSKMKPKKLINEKYN